MYLAPPPGPWGAAAPDMQRLRLTGNFTTLRHVLHRTPLELERRLGFHPGRLAEGGWLIALAPGETMRGEDFRLDASTRWSGGKFAPDEPDGDDRSMEDILGQRSAQHASPDVEELRQRVARFFAKHWLNTPAKVLPAQRHTPTTRYPHAQALALGVRSGVPQFTVTAPLGKRAAIAMPIRAYLPRA